MNWRTIQGVSHLYPDYVGLKKGMEFGSFLKWDTYNSYKETFVHKDKCVNMNNSR